MSRFLSEDRRPDTDLSTVESTRNDLFLEEFPEGPYGASLVNNLKLGRSKPWRIDQDTHFGYENIALHEDLSRGFPGEDPIEDTGEDQ
ncbi:hypothetical protein [Cohnella sp. JJ-181]|uniref:hypothetical protein n=1 Tax=Cohnella rhizoplanae TaxID=2974897 RepID=UPI0022FF69A9|nr:hypothetical protein [Cohnella sp. JJ-181]CAI6046360.1 hypothetical protein COHCIP112018_01294 [Cohnella sp. JJ-181]